MHNFRIEDLADVDHFVVETHLGAHIHLPSKEEIALLRQQ